MKNFVAGLIVLLAGAAFAGETELGAVLPDGAHRVAEHRFKAVTDFDGVLKFYKSTYPAANYPRKSVINQPGVKAVHISNPSGKGGWDGLNIYQAVFDQVEEVRIYVVPADGSRRKKK